MREEIERLILTKNGTIKNKTVGAESLLERIRKEYPAPDDKTSIYCAYHSLQCKRCPQCGVELSVSTFKTGWIQETCSRRCFLTLYPDHRKETAKKMDYTAIKEKGKKTMLERYGSENALSVPEFMARKRKTMTDRYGVEHALHVPEFLDKMKMTSLQRYGETTYAKTAEFRHYISETLKGRKDIQEKIRETVRARYGVDCVFHLQEVKDKSRETMLSRHGVAYYTQHKEYMGKRVKTCMEKYGVPSYAESEEFKERVKALMIERYGVESALQDKGLSKKKDETCVSRYGKPHYAMTDEFKERVKETITITYGSPYIFTSSHFQEKMKGYWADRISKPQRKLSDYVKGLGYDVSDNDRSVISPLEVDIYLPALKMGFEVDGFWWHSIGEGEPLDVVWDRYNRKQRKATENGITIHHFTDFDITHSFESVKHSVQLILSGEFEKTTSIDSHKGRKFVRESFT